VSPRHRPFSVFVALAVLATLLVIVGPLISRWQAYGVLPAASSALEAPSPAGMSMEGMHHHHHAAMAAAAEPAAAAASPAPAPAKDPHAGHRMGVDCDYCLLAARLLPWLVFALLVLPLLRAPAPRLVQVVGRTGKAWHGHLGARGPPLAVGPTPLC